VQSIVRTVVVYPDAASLTREVVGELPDGESTVLFSDIPYAAILDSMRALGESQAPLIIGAVERPVSCPSRTRP
jgi:hypothetical protein